MLNTRVTRACGGREGANTRIACYERINAGGPEFLLRINWLSTLINVDRLDASFAWPMARGAERGVGGGGGERRQGTRVRACENFLFAIASCKHPCKF